MAAVLAGVAVVVGAVAWGLSVWVDRATPPVTEERVQGAVFGAIRGEAPAAFLVTGRLELMARTRVENTKVFLPGLVGLDLGTARATVRVPGTVSYGFAVDSVKPEMVRLREDGVVEIGLPPLAVYSVEPRLGRLEVATERGWARRPSREGEVERRALALVERAMRRQAEAHLRTSKESRVNAARALERLLKPALQGLGMEDPRFRIRISDELVLRPTG